MASFLARRGVGKGQLPPVFQPASDAQKAIFLKHFGETRNVATACRAAGIRRNVYAHAMADDPAFREAHAELDEFYIDKIEGVAFDLAFNRRDPVMVKFLLEKLRPEKYGPKAKVEVSHRFQSAEDIRKLSDEDLLATFEEMKLELEG